MTRISANELLSRLEKGKAIPAILLLGEEPYLRDRCRALLMERYVPDAARPWAVSRYSADRRETQAALEQAQTMAMLSPVQLVFLEDAEAIESLGEKSRDDAVELLAAYLNDPAPFTVLVIEALRLDQRMKWGKLLTEKALVVSEKTTTVWELAAMLASRQGKKALEFLDRLLREGEEPLQMLGAMTWMYRKLIEASELRGVTNGWGAARALAMRPEQAQLALESARKIPKARLLAGLAALQRADERLKGGREDARAVMEFLIAELTGGEALAARR